MADHKVSKMKTPPPLRNRAELINALTVASQLEHGLMLMYLYAAFSMKSNTAELKGQGESPEVLRYKLRNWEASILLVARQEMEHLGFVCNLLSAIGGNQYFDRANFPQSPKYWPVDLPVELERFGVRSLLRFMAYEKPKNLVDDFYDKLLEKVRHTPRMLASPQVPEIKFDSIAQLYRLIRDAFEQMPEEQLFIVPPDAQVDGTMLTLNPTGPTYNITLFKTWDRQSAINAVDEIIEQGEGTLIRGKVTVEDLDPGCHYMLFRSVLRDYLGADNLEDPDPERTVFEGARPCVRNPALELHQDTITRTVYKGGGVQPDLSVALITHPWTKEMMGIFNTAYESLLQMLIRLYTFSDDTDADNNTLVNTAFFPMMTMVIRPLSELMSLLPAFGDKGNGGLTAGPGFEYFRIVGFLPHKPAAWIYIHERLAENALAFREAIAHIPKDVSDALRKGGYDTGTQLPFIAQNLTRIASNFKTYTNI